MAKTCAEGRPEEPREEEPKLAFDDDMKREINEMLLEGKSSKDVADYYGIGLATANHLIAKAKGIELSTGKNI